MVCTRLAPEGGAGRFVTKVWPVDATTNAILELAGHLAGLQIEKVVLESTDYWRPFFYLLEAAGLDVMLVNARDVKNAPGRPKTDPARCGVAGEAGRVGHAAALVRPPPPEIRALRDYTRLRTDLTRERTRHWQRLEKLLEDALIKVTTVASRIDTMSVRDMLEALIAGQRDPQVLADLARGRMRAKRPALVEALTGRFDEHHGELAAILLAQIDGLSVQVDALTTRIEALIAAIPAAQGVDADGSTGPQAGLSPGAPALTAIGRLQEIPGISRHAAQVIIAEAGLDMTRFPTAGHLVSWARLCPRTLQSGARERPGRTGKGNPYLKGVLGDAAAAAGKTDTFLGERYRRLVRRRGKLKALVAIARALLVIVWHLLADRSARYHDLGPDYHASRTDTTRRTRSHVRQLEALGFTVTLTPAPDPATPQARPAFAAAPWLMLFSGQLHPISTDICPG
jgi:transposase